MTDPHPNSPLGRAVDADRRRRDPRSTTEALYVDRDGTVRLNYTVLDRTRREREPDLARLIGEREALT